MRKFRFPIALCTAILLSSCASTNDRLTQFPPSPAAETGALFTNDDALKRVIRDVGPRAAMDALVAVALRDGIECHNRSHQLGRMSFEEYGDEVFKLVIPECHSGFYHGAIEAYFRKFGTAKLEQNLATICMADLNGFFTHQCIHGIGHGLMAWSDYALPEALEYCNMIPQDGGKSSCRTGVFMENIVASLADSAEAKELGHISKYVSDDPQFPCTIVKEEYKNDCYFLQTDQMLRLSTTDFEGVARECERAPKPYRHSCFGSMGRTVGGRFRGDPGGAIRACEHSVALEYRIECILGAAQDTFWDKNGKELALTFCAIVPEEEGKAECYRTIIGRSHEILTLTEQRSFCLDLPPEHRSGCLEQIP